MSRTRSSIVIAGLAFLVTVGGARAQAGRYPEVEAPAVQIEFAKPFFEGEGIGFATSVLEATLLAPLGGNTLFAAWGVSYGTIDGASSSTTTSNLRVGAAFGEAGATRGELHVDLPVASEHGDDDFATGFGIVTDYERLERFVPDAWAIGGSIAPHRSLTSGAVIGGRLGATLMIPTEDGPDSELLLLPAAFATLPAGTARIGAELSASIIASEEGLSLGERSILQTTLWVGLPSASLAPDFYLRIPLDDDLGEILDFVLGVRVLLGG